VAFNVFQENPMNL